MTPRSSVQMATQPSPLRPTEPHIHLAGANCPTCGQPIANEKMSEITAKLVARDQQTASTVRGQLERDYAIRIEKLANDNAATVERLKQEAVDREAAARKEAEAALQETLREAARQRQAAEDANAAMLVELQTVR